MPGNEPRCRQIDTKKALQRNGFLIQNQRRHMDAPPLPKTAFNLSTQRETGMKKAGSQEQCWVVSRVFRKLVCSPWLNEVSQQWRHPQWQPPGASCSCISCCPIGYRPRGVAARRPASEQSCRPGSCPPHGFGDGFPGLVSQ